MKYLYRKNFSQLLVSLMIVSLGVLLQPSAIAQEQLTKYKNSRMVHEDVTAVVISSGDDGSGQLRIFEESCSGCYVDISFDSRTHLNTPLGHYYGLDKLADWSDYAINVSVSRETGKAVSVSVRP